MSFRQSRFFSTSDDFRQMSDDPQERSNETRELVEILETGKAFYEQKQYDAALIAFEKLQRRSVENNDLHVFGVAHSWLGLTLKKLNRLEDSIQCHLADLKAADILDDDEARFRAVNNLGTTYLAMKDWKKGAEYREKSIELATKANASPQLLAQLWGNLGYCYTQLKNLPDATTAHRNEAMVAQLTEDPQVQIGALEKLAYVLHEQSLHEEEAKVYQQLADVHKKQKSESDEVWALSSMGWALLNAQQYDAAAKPLTIAVERAEQLKMPTHQIFALSGLGQVKVHQKKWQDAIKYHRREVEVALSLPPKQKDDDKDPKIIQMEAHGRFAQALFGAKEYELAMMELNKRLQLALDLNDAQEQQITLATMKQISDEQHKNNFVEVVEIKSE